jgi:trigger factor
LKVLTLIQVEAFYSYYNLLFLNYTKLEVIVEKNPEVLEALIKVTVNEADYQEKFDKKLKEYAKKAFVKGFRQGKVPPMIIKKLYGKAIKVEEINQIAVEALYKYIQDEKLQVFGSPMLATEKMEKIDWDFQKDIDFVYEVGLQPEVSFDFSSDFTTKEYEIAISDKDVDNFIQNSTERFASYEDKEEIELITDVWGRFSPTSEEVLFLDDKEFTAGKEFFGMIDVDTLSETHQALFLGKKIDDSITFDLRTVFPTDEALASFLRYGVEEVKNIKGEITYKITAITTRTMPELNTDLFTKILGNKVQIESVDDFKTEIKAILQKRYTIAARLETLFNFINQLDAKTEINFPNTFLRKWLVSQNETQTLTEEAFDNFMKSLHTQMAIDKVSQNNEITISQEDLLDYAKEVEILNLFAMGFLQGINDEGMLSLFAERHFKESEENEQTLASFERNIRAYKLFDLVREKITVEKVILSGEELDKLVRE